MLGAAVVGEAEGEPEGATVGALVVGAADGAAGLAHPTPVEDQQVAEQAPGRAGEERHEVPFDPLGILFLGVDKPESP